MSVTLYLEGAATGPDSKESKIRCREGFRKLLEKCGFKERMPRLFASGPRSFAFDDFKTAIANMQSGDFIAMWIDSEDPVENLNATWEHLKKRDGWDKPKGANDDQVLFMTTCMETLIIADRSALAQHYQKLQDSALPPVEGLETRRRQDTQESLFKATHDCTNAYRKTKRSFEVLSKLDPDTLARHLPSFARTRRILQQNLK